MDFSYPKHEKLKSRKTIDAMFAKGQSVSKYPLRLVFSDDCIVEKGTILFGVSVSKKHFKSASDRNYFKRVLRETYRLNKQILTDKLDRPFAFMLLYQSKDRLSYDEINEKTVAVFEKFAARFDEISGN